MKENPSEHSWDHTLPACWSNLEVNNIFPLFTAATVISLEEQTTLQWHSGDEEINHHTKTVGVGVSADEKECGWESHRKETKDKLRKGCWMDQLTSSWVTLNLWNGVQLALNGEISFIWPSTLGINYFLDFNFSFKCYRYYVGFELPLWDSHTTWKLSFVSI